jgi:hypothetical protein
VSHWHLVPLCHVLDIWWLNCTALSLGLSQGGEGQDLFILNTEVSPDPKLSSFLLCSHSTTFFKWLMTVNIIEDDLVAFRGSSGSVTQFFAFPESLANSQLL